MRTLVVTSSIATLSLAAMGVSAASGVHTYTGADSGRTVHVSVKQEFKVSLKTASDGGYSWAFAGKLNTDVVKLVSKHVVPNHHKPGVVGGFTHTVYTFRAVGVGTEKMHLVESQPFNKKSAPVKKFSLTENVTK